MADRWEFLTSYFLIVLFQSTAKERAKHAGDYFTLLRHLLNYAYNSNINLPNAEVLLNNEIDWLKRIRVEYPLMK